MNTADKNLGLLKNKTLLRIFLSSCLLIISTILNLHTALNLFRNFWLRVNLGLDLTDESFNLMNLTNSQDNFAWPYSRILGPIFNLLNKDIAQFRIADLVILSVLCLFGSVITLSEARKGKSKNILLLPSAISLQVVIILFVPSVFRYLLVTPGYQWILITGSLLLTILLIGIVPRHSGRSA